MARGNTVPKTPDKRARRNREAVGFRVVEVETVPQPDLPTFYVESDGRLVEFEWPARSREVWTMLGESAMAAEFTAVEWADLTDAMLFHAAMWRGDLKAGTEFRLRMAKYGVTPEDRLRLRIQHATAEDVEDKRATKRAAQTRDRSRNLRTG